MSFLDEPRKPPIDDRIPCRKQWDSYTMYDVYHKIKPKKEGIQPKLFTDIAKAMNNKIVTKLLEGHEITVPYLGTFLIWGDTKPRRIVNWKATWEMWERRPDLKEKKQLVVYLNDHTEGIIYRIAWVQSRINNSLQRAYRFYPAESFRKMLYDRIMAGQKYKSKYEKVQRQEKSE